MPGPSWVVMQKSGVWRSRESLQASDTARDPQSMSSMFDSMNMLKELCDIMYVVSGFAVTFGMPVQPAFVRVHKSNMSKLVDGKPVVDAGGKVLKGENYEPPTMEGLI